MALDSMGYTHVRNQGFSGTFITMSGVGSVIFTIVVVHFYKKSFRGQCIGLTFVFYPISFPYMYQKDSISPEPPMTTISLETLEAEIDKLKKLRNWLVEDYGRRIKSLEDEKNEYLQSNFQLLRRLGVPVDEIPHATGAGGNKRKYAKLDHPTMASLLSEFLRTRESVPTREILAHLNISLPDFVRFNRENVGFLLSSGFNKARKWRLSEDFDKKLLDIR
jgi:hypothetical protein